MKQTDLYIGLLSGTSMDAVDAALVDFSGDKPRLLAVHRQVYPPALQQALQGLIEKPQSSLANLGGLDVWVAEIFAQATNQLMQNSTYSREQIQAIGNHGQNIYHAPQAEHPFSWQIGDPNVIATHTHITTVADFRRKDIALGGQGAPLTPAFHAQFMRQDGQDSIVLNIGGIANITVLPCSTDQKVIGFDTGPGNTLLDNWVQQHQNMTYDDKGRWAAQGRVDETLLARCLADPYFHHVPPKSTGREYFNLTWLQNYGGNCLMDLAPVDVQATLSQLTANSIAQAITDQGLTSAPIFVCGGGIHNEDLLSRLRQCLPQATVQSSQVMGIDPDWLEAMAFAWFAKQTLQGQTSNLPSVTGASRAIVLGGIYPV